MFPSVVMKPSHTRFLPGPRSGPALFGLFALLLGACVQPIAQSREPVPGHVEIKPLELEFRGNTSIKRSYDLGESVRIQTEGSPSNPRHVRLVTHDGFQGVLYLSDGDGALLEPQPVAEVAWIEGAPEEGMNPAAAVSTGTAIGGLFGGWFFYNAFEYIRYVDEELIAPTLAGAIVTGLIGAYVMHDWYAIPDVRRSSLGPDGDWMVRDDSGMFTPPVPSPSSSAESAGSEAPEGGEGALEGDHPMPENPSPPSVATSRWAELQGRLVMIEVEGMWRRVRVGTAHAEGVQIKSIGALRGTIVPYGRITAVQELSPP